jgi:nicotinamide-nucleotide amidase
MPSAEIITIGTELLLGEIQDTNTQYLARFLRDLGIDLYRTTIVGDNEDRIAQVIREAMQRCQIIITTGGLGPTVDDPTRTAVAKALGVEIEFRPELWEQILARFKRFNRQASENNRKQAYIPAGSIPVENPVGTAPAFIGEMPACSIISLPGVPREMEYLMQNAVLPYLKQRFDVRGTIKARVLHVAGVGESIVDEWVADLEALANPTVGLLAHPGQVDIRITAKADSIEQADQMIAEMEAEVRRRVQEGLFGADRDTLEEVVIQRLKDQGWSLALVECNLGGSLLKRLTRLGFSAEDAQIITGSCPLADLQDAANRFCQERNADVALGISVHPEPEKYVVNVAILTPSGASEYTRAYGGERALSNPWAINTGLELLRRVLIQ